MNQIIPSKTFNQMHVSRPNMCELNGIYDSLIARLEQGDAILSCFIEWNKLRDRFASNYTLSEVHHSLNTKDEKFKNDKLFFDTNNPQVIEWNNRFIRALLAHKEYKTLENKLGCRLTVLLQLQLDGFDSRIKEHIRLERELITIYTDLMAGWTFSFKGEKLNLSSLHGYFFDKDRLTRYEAQRLRAEAFQKNGKELDRLYDELVKLRTEKAKVLGFKSYTELGYKEMRRVDYGPQEVASFRKQVISQVVPKTIELRKRQVERLGIDKLMLWDELLLSREAPKPVGDEASILAKSDQMYMELSPETAKFIKILRQNGLLDTTSRVGKAFGGYCTSFPEERIPFVFANFNKSCGDVVVMTHECGHAFQYWMSCHHELEEYRWPSMDACEIFSYGMEYLTFPWMELFFEEQADQYRREHLEQQMLAIPFCSLIDHFQHEVYANPYCGSEQRHKIWKELEAIYLPDRNYGDLSYFEKGAFWQKQTHLYERPFYMIDYALAQVCALQIYTKSQKDFGAAFQDYLKICTAGGCLSFLEIVKLGGLKNPFLPETLEKVFVKG